MDSNTEIYTLLKNSFTSVHIGNLPQSVDLQSDTPIILIQFINLEPTNMKDGGTMDFETAVINVFATSYKNAKEATAVIRNTLSAYESSCIREVEFENKEYIWEADIETNRYNLTFKIHTKCIT